MNRETMTNDLTVESNFSKIYQINVFTAKDFKQHVKNSSANKKLILYK